METKQRLDNNPVGFLHSVQNWGSTSDQNSGPLSFQFFACFHSDLSVLRLLSCSNEAQCTIPERTILISSLVLFLFMVILHHQFLYFISPVLYTITDLLYCPFFLPLSICHFLLVESFMFLGVQITSNLSWSLQANAIRKPPNASIFSAG